MNMRFPNSLHFLKTESIFHIIWLSTPYSTCKRKNSFMNYFVCHFQRTTTLKHLALIVVSGIKGNAIPGKSWALRLQITTQMTYLCPCLSRPEFGLEQNWDQSEIRIFLPGINIKAVPFVSSSESKQSTKDYRFSFLQTKLLLCHLLCLFLPPIRPLRVLS